MSRLIMSMALVFLCGVLSASVTVKVKSIDKNCIAGDQLEMTVILDENESNNCEISVFIESGETNEKLGTIICRKGENHGKWLISEKYAGKSICIKFVDNAGKVKAYSSIIKIANNKPE